jgi:hypothetical protein
MIASNQVYLLITKKERARRASSPSLFTLEQGLPGPAQMSPAPIGDPSCPQDVHSPSPHPESSCLSAAACGGASRQALRDGCPQSLGSKPGSRARHKSER